MNISNLIRQHFAALRALLVLTVITGLAYPALIWGIAQLPGLHDKAEGSLVKVNGQIVGSSLIGQAFTDAKGNAIPKYFQSRPSAAGTGYDPTASGGTNLGPESIVDTPGDPAKGGTAGASDPKNPSGFKASLLTTVCGNSATVGSNESVDGSRPFCTPASSAQGASVGAVLSLIGDRDLHGNVVSPKRVISINEPCTSQDGKGSKVAPFIATYRGVPVECADYQEAVSGVYAVGQIVPVRGNAPDKPVVPADAVTNSGSGLDPHISPEYADLQVARVAKARGISPDLVRAAITDNESGRDLGFMGEPRVNVVKLNLELDQKYPVKG